jgi:hypothetical protein
LLETREGSYALGKARVAILGEGTALVACAFGDAVVAPRSRVRSVSRTSHATTIWRRSHVAGPLCGQASAKS